jgi:uncharacterized SAM-binding protein YcdF (DUF218 family)
VNFLRKIKRLLLTVGILAITLSLVMGSLYLHIVRYGLENDQGNADVIIVLGAAVWPNGPSPALRARVWRGSTLFHEGRAPYLILTGGLGLYPPAEAEAMAVLAQSWDVDQRWIRIENRSSNTRENMFYAAEIMKENGWTSALIVTDYFHMKRAVLLAEDYGIETLRAPVSVEMSYYVPRERFRYTLRECAALLHYRTTRFINRE